MSNTPIPTWFFSAIVVRAGDRFVLVRETGEEERWGLPGGKLDPGESFLDAARRETLEEAGIEVEPLGILGFEHTPLPNGQSRMGVAFRTDLPREIPLKTVADAESLGATWFTLADLDALPLRSERVARLIRAAFTEMPLIPLDRLRGLKGPRLGA